MLILCSNGLSSEKLQTYIRSKMIGCKNEEKCRTYEKTHNVNVIRINDGEGVFIDKEIHICRL
jgi:hypothetical protein